MTDNRQPEHHGISLWAVAEHLGRIPGVTRATVSGVHAARIVLDMPTGAFVVDVSPAEVAGPPMAAWTSGQHWAEAMRLLAEAADEPRAVAVTALTSRARLHLETCRMLGGWPLNPGAPDGSAWPVDAHGHVVPWVAANQKAAESLHYARSLTGPAPQQAAPEEPEDLSGDGGLFLSPSAVAWVLRSITEPDGADPHSLTEQAAQVREILRTVVLVVGDGRIAADALGPGGRETLCAWLLGQRETLVEGRAMGAREIVLDITYAGDARRPV